MVKNRQKNIKKLLEVKKNPFPQCKPRLNLKSKNNLELNSAFVVI